MISTSIKPAKSDDHQPPGLKLRVAPVAPMNPAHHSISR